MSARAAVLLWAQRVIGRKGVAAHQILEIPDGSGFDAVQAAFHKIARMAHPDLHRTTLNAEELELVTTAYARAAAAYQELRSQCRPATTSTSRMRPVRDASDPAVTPPRTSGTGPPKPATRPSTAPLPVQPDNPGQAMNAKALLHYRKAELGLRRGDLTAAVLQLKMAVASDPQSTFLRTALAEVEAEVRKKP